MRLNKLKHSLSESVSLHSHFPITFSHFLEEKKKESHQPNAPTSV